MKKRHLVSAALLSLFTPLAAQEAVAKWDVQLPPPVVVETPVEPRAEPAPAEFEVLASRTKRVQVKEAPEMPGLPPVEGAINLTIQKVANPGLPDPPPPLPALPPDDPAVLARMEELRETCRGTELAFLSASVHLENQGSDDARTLLRIYPDGQTGKEVAAWTNLNLLHLCGQGGYRVNHAGGTFRNIGFLMGVSPVYDRTLRRIAQRAGREHQAPGIPELPDLAAAGPAFVLVEGDADSPAYATLEQIHDLFRKSGDTLRDQYLAMEKARGERRARLLAQPAQRPIS